jgi:lipid-A-disaccharide synthase-like uncharacterized protein
MNVHFDIVFFNNRFLGIEWNTWKMIGWVGNIVFFSRFVVQWWATEKKKEVVVPNSFWWLSLIGSLLLLAFAIKQKQSVFIFAYAFTWIPYIRNLVISYRAKEALCRCENCRSTCGPRDIFCSQCGRLIRTTPEPPSLSAEPVNR